MKCVVKGLIEEIPSSNSFTGNFYQMLNEEIIPFLGKLFQKTEKEDMFPELFHEASIT